MMSKGYTITIDELLERPIIRNDYDEEWMNKMSDEELNQFDNESYEICLDEGVPKKYPDLNAAHLSKHIDRTILYNIFKESQNNNLCYCGNLIDTSNPDCIEFRLCKEHVQDV
jgi:hypothetical protein